MNLPFTLFVLSDLHLEFCQVTIDKYIKRIPETDVLILAGDIGMPNKKHFSRFLKICSERHDLVIFVVGNHEYWSEMSDVEINELCTQYGVIMLQNELIEYEGVVFIGSTLWTQLKYLETNEEIKNVHLMNMNDFDRIPWMNNEVWKQKHKTAINFIEKSLNDYEKCPNSKHKPCIVITHHTPSHECLPKEYDGDPLNGCYATNLDYLFDRPNLKAWIFGHTHKSMCKKVGKNKDMILFGNSGRMPSTYEFYPNWCKSQDNIWNQC